MIRYGEIKKYIQRGVCRECINKTFGISLEREDCTYYYQDGREGTHYLRYRCPCCGEEKHVVHSVLASKRHKFWFHKRPKKEE